MVATSWRGEAGLGNRVTAEAEHKYIYIYFNRKYTFLRPLNVCKLFLHVHAQLSHPLLQGCLCGVRLCWWRVHSAAPQQTEEGWETAGPTGTHAACVHPDCVLLATTQQDVDTVIGPICTIMISAVFTEVALTASSFSIRPNNEGMRDVYKVPSSVVQAAKAGMKTWWTALTTRSDGSPRDRSMSSKPFRGKTYIICL